MVRVTGTEVMSEVNGESPVRKKIFKTLHKLVIFISLAVSQRPVTTLTNGKFFTQKSENITFTII